MSHVFIFFFSDNIVDLKVTNYWQLTNPNYYPIQLVSLNVQAYHDKLLTETSNSTSKGGGREREKEREREREREREKEMLKCETDLLAK